jgi:hypothetical protein
MVDLAISCSIRNEATYLREWIEFHRLVGVSRFYLYSHWSTDEYQRVLAPYIAEGIVRLHRWWGYRAHPGVRRHCLRTYSDDARWIAFLDADEFLFPTMGDSLPAELTSYSDHPGVVVHWQVFGSSKHKSRPPGLVIENYLHRASDDRAINHHVKSIVQPQMALRPQETHTFSFLGGARAVNERYESITSPLPPSVVTDRLRINHYFCKSREEGEIKCRKGQVDRHPQRTMEEWEIYDRECSDLEDRTILRFLPTLKERLAQQTFALQ